MEINGFVVDEYNVYGIKPNATAWTCPVCSSTRKKKNDKCMSVFWDTGLGKCNHCGESTQLHTYKKKEFTKTYIKPKSITTISPYTDKFKAYMQKRGITEPTLKSMKVRETKEWMPQEKTEMNCIAFDYYLKDELINTKFRDGKKNFKMVKDAEKIFYNLDAIVGAKEALIVEGEMDSLSWVEAGYKYSISVPNGFNLQGNLTLDYLDGYMDYFDGKDVIYIGVDNDEAGKKGQKELVRRLGVERCKIVTYGDCKDANEYLSKHGIENLIKCLKSAKEIQIEGVFTVSMIETEMMNAYLNGQRRGTTTYYPEIDKVWTWREGEVNLWTGYNNEGKSALLNGLHVARALNEGVKAAFVSPENMPMTDFFNDFIETLIGKSTDPYYASNYMNTDEFKFGLEWCNYHFFLIYPEKDLKIDSIFEKARYLVRRKGIRSLVIDPYNTIEHMMKPNEREDLYISRFMSQLKRFAVEEDISVHLIAHQNTPRKNKDDEGRYFKPDAGNIKGGGTFGDKADNVMFVWRPNRALDFKDSEVIFGSQKIKKQKLVGIPGEVENIIFDIRKQRYYINGISPFEDFDRQRPVSTMPAIRTAYQPELSILQTTDEIPF